MPLERSLNQLNNRTLPRHERANTQRFGIGKFGGGWSLPSPLAEGLQGWLHPDLLKPWYVERIGIFVELEAAEAAISLHPLDVVV